MYTLSDDETDTATHYSDKGIDGYTQPVLTDKVLGPGEYQVRESLVQKYVKGSPWGAAKAVRKSTFDVPKDMTPASPEPEPKVPAAARPLQDSSFKSETERMQYL